MARSPGEAMRRVFLLVLVLGVALLVVGVVVLGAFPPEPGSKQIQRVLPNDRFAR